VVFNDQGDAALSRFRQAGLDVFDDDFEPFKNDSDFIAALG